MKYSIIYADPPWIYRDKALAGQRGAECKYPVMTDNEIMALDVRSIAADNSALFLWTTWPRIKTAFEVIRAWGFTYKTLAFDWIKTTKHGKEFMGMGNYTRANSEPCLLAVRGRPKRVCASVRQIIRRPILRHSQKPPEARERIVQLMGDLPRVELFARERTPGWHCWGNEVESDIELSSSASHPSVRSRETTPALLC